MHDREVHVMTTEFQVKGLKELQRFLDTLPAKVEANIMRGALRAGAKPILESARSSAPVGEPSENGRKKYNHYVGALRDSFRVSGRINSRKGEVTVSVKAGGKVKKTGADVFYAHMVEFGTKPHAIRKGGKVSHPGTSPRPFMRPALDSKSGEAVVAAGNYIKRRLSTKHGLDVGDIDISLDSE